MEQSMDELARAAAEVLASAELPGLGGIARVHAALEPLFRAQGFREEAEGGMCSILVAGLGAMGDNVLLSPFLRELRRHFFSAHITLVASPEAYPLMELCPYVNEVLCFDGMRLFRRGREREEALRMLDFCRRHLWRHRYDLALLPIWGSAPVGMRFFCYLSGARRRRSYSDRVNGLYLPEEFRPTDEDYLLTEAVVNPPELIHEADRFLYLLESMGVVPAERQTELWLGAQDVRRARELLGGFGREGCLIALVTGAGFPNRKYPLEQWLEAMGEIAGLGGRFVLLGGASEAEEGAFLGAHMPGGTVLDLTGKTSMRESAAVLSLTEMYLGNDTGMMHAAVACGRPVIVIYREAADKEGVYTGVCSEFRRFEPYLADYIALRPEHAMGACRDVVCYGGCVAREAHCIRQVPPEEIVRAFSILAARRE